MVRTLAFALLLVVGASAAQHAAAITISKNNPYRSFNISGINYGSVNWERTHGKTSSQSFRSGGLFGRGR